jgi:chemotaxis methyl-accepting protein methylase
MRRMSRFESRDAPSASEAHAFFRDPLAWDYVAEEVLPAILARKGEDDAIRVWSAGCGAGEEVYTLAILLCEESSQRIEMPGRSPGHVAVATS